MAMKKFGILFLLTIALFNSSFGQKKSDGDKEIKSKSSDVGPHIYDHDTTIKKGDDIFVVENLGEKINSSHIESGPRISPDGKQLYFFRVNHPKNYSHTRDIWVSDYNEEDSSWTEADHLRPPLNNYGDNSVHSISPDGKTLLLHNEYMKNGLTKNGVSITHYDEEKGEWSFPEKLNIKGYKNDQTCSFYLCDDQKTLILAIHADDSRGEQDLYVSFLDEKEKWSEPLNLGPIVNTELSEATAFVFADGETLYYSSNGKPGDGPHIGKFDIYKTTRLDSTWTNWTTPENMGSPWNTPDDEFYFSIPAKGDYSYLSHHFVGSDSSEHSDIVRIKMIEHPTLLAHVRVFDAYTNERISANANVRKAKSPEVTAPSILVYDGEIADTNTYDLKMDGNNYYTWKFSKDDYVPFDTIMDLTKLEGQNEDTIDIYIKQNPHLNATFIVLDEESGDTLKYALTTIYEKDNEDKPVAEGAPKGNEPGFKTRLDGGKVYTAVFSDGEYYVERRLPEDIDLTDLKTVKDTTITIRLKPILESSTFTIPNIYFIFAKAEIDPVSNESLNVLTEALKKHDVILKAEIGGHTDSRGSKINNKDLSDRRAQAIVDYLVEKGIDKNRLVHKGYGEDEPVNKCVDGVKCSEDEHLANRRVVLKVLEVKKRRKADSREK